MPGPFTYGKGRKIGDLTDGTSNTLLTAEVVVPLSDRYTGLWGDVMISLGGELFTGWQAPNSKVGGEVFRWWLKEAGANPNGVVYTKIFNREGVQIGARSKHTGGVQAALGDGSVRFFSESIDLGVSRGASSAAGGEVLGDF